MHLKSYPKLVRSELHLDAAGIQMSPQRSGVFIHQQGALLRTCSSNHGNISSSRLPFSIISTSTLRCTNVSGSVASLQLKASSSAALRLLPTPPGCNNNSLRLYQAATEDEDAPHDIWTVIKPGHVREKIAIFASEGGRTDGAECSEPISNSTSSSQGRTAVACVNHVNTSGLSRPTKAKGSWEENCGAKRRRRSGNSQSLQQDQKTKVLDTQLHVVKPSLCHSDTSQQSGGGGCGNDMVTMVEEEGHKVSVVEMVAFLEQRASKQQPDCKPMLGLQKSSTTITLSRAPPSVVRDRSEVKGEEPESIKVSDMVAKLESECLRRRTEGDLSRSNSLRRSVGRVLLVAGDKSPAPSRPTSQLSSVTSSSLSSLVGAQSQSREPISCTETARTESPASAQTTPPPLHSGEPVVEPQEARGGVGLQTHSAVSAQTAVTLPLSEEAEPLPGLLFLTSPPADSYPPADLDLCSLTHNMTFDLVAAHSQSFHPSVSASPHSGSQLEKRQRRRANSSLEEEAGVSPSLATVPVSRHVSQDFLEIRQRLQQLLEPQPYLAVLPHHLLVKIFLLLPTQSLAALKCTCHYFKFVIENYCVRPADSLWVSDPRYRDDPCKQCKKRYGRGDVSLCRWHHKPYCQALPYGPGYWMCCHGAHRDTPGCNVGLHDNRWVPAFHSINVPIYRRSRDEDN